MRLLPMLIILLISGQTALQAQAGTAPRVGLRTGVRDMNEPRNQKEYMRNKYSEITGLRVVPGTTFDCGTAANHESCRPHGFIRADGLDQITIGADDQGSDAKISGNVTASYLGGVYNPHQPVQLQCASSAQSALDSTRRVTTVSTDSVGQAVRSSLVESAVFAFEASLSVPRNQRDQLVASFRSAMERELAQTSTRDSRLKWIYTSVREEVVGIPALQRCRDRVRRGGGIITGVAGLLIVDAHADYHAIDLSSFDRAAQAALGMGVGPAVAAAKAAWSRQLGRMVDTNVITHSQPWTFYPIWMRVTDPSTI